MGMMVGQLDQGAGGGLRQRHAGRELPVRLVGDRGLTPGVVRGRTNVTDAIRVLVSSCPPRSGFGVGCALPAVAVPLAQSVGPSTPPRGILFGLVQGRLRTTQRSRVFLFLRLALPPRRLCADARVQLSEHFVFDFLTPLPRNAFRCFLFLFVPCCVTSCRRWCVCACLLRAGVLLALGLALVRCCFGLLASVCSRVCVCVRACFSSRWTLA